jgi:hypothetical protein
VRKFPDTVMASNGPQRGYTASQSTGYLDIPGWYAFGGSVSWISEDNYQLSGGTSAYNPSNGNVSSDDSMVAGGNTYEGDWIQLQLPHGVKFTSFKVSVPPSSAHASIHNRGIKNGILAGSNNGSSWDVLKIIGSGHVSTGSGLTWSQDETKTITIDTNTSNYYKYVRLLATAVQGGTTGGYWSIDGSGLEFYGTQESTPVLARLGGSFEGKIANTRVYDRSIGERQVLEVWDAEKDRFGRGESSITVHKGRLGVGTKTPQATLDVRGNIFGPLLTHRSYVWRKPGIIYVPASQECRILAQVVEIPEMYKNISPLNLRLSYKWTFFGESSGTPENMVWRTSVKHSGNTVEHMNTGMEGNRPIGVTNWVLGFTIQNSNTPDQAFIPGSYQLKNVTGDTIEIGLDLYPYPSLSHTLYVNRGVSGDDGADDERGCSTLTVFMEPY